MSTVSLLLAGYLGEIVNATPHLGDSQWQRLAQSNLVSATVEQCLLSLCGVNVNVETPLAHYLSLAEGLTIPRQRWLVQPVHMQLQRDTFALTQALALDIAEFVALSALLNGHFSADGIRFEPSRSHRYWYLSLSQPANFQTYALQSVVGQNVQHFQPAGPDASIIRRVMNEVQMLLHEHPLNQGRLAQGLPEINSMWVSGGGKVPDLQRPTVLGGNGDLIQGIRLACDEVANIPLKEAIAKRCASVVWYVEDAENLDWSWLLTQVKCGRIKQLALHLPQQHRTRVFTLTPLDCWKFWRKFSPLHAD